MAHTAPLDLRTLTSDECLELLASVHSAHLATTYRALPVIVPVAIEVVDGDLAIEAPIDDVVPLVSGSVVAVEAGTFDTTSSAPWTVQVRGLLQRRPDASRSGVAPYLVSTELISGWRAGDDPARGRTHAN